MKLIRFFAILVSALASVSTFEALVFAQDSTPISVDPPGGEPAPQPPDPPQPPQAPPASVCGVVVDPQFVCEPPYDPPINVANMKCSSRGRCKTDPVTRVADCVPVNAIALEEYEGVDVRKKIDQVQAAPNNPNAQQYTISDEECYRIYDCKSKCVKEGRRTFCVREEDPRQSLPYKKYTHAGDCPLDNPPQQPNPPPNVPEAG